VADVVTGMGRLAAAVLCVFVLVACGGGEGEATPVAGVRILALGDSYTIGESVAEAERWPVQLASLLRERGLDVAEPEIVARTGWTTGELAAAIEERSPVGPFDLVTLLIGVNNEYRGGSAEAYRPEFRALLETAIAFADGDAGRVIVLSIPDWSVTPFAEGRDRAALSRSLDAFNAVAREEAEAAGVVFVDITPGSRAAADDSSLIAADGLHPSGAMYAQWAEAALPPAEAILRAN
jgi:lysophospholipase L1-like esterase